MPYGKVSYDKEHSLLQDNKGIQPEELFKKEIESYKVKNQSFLRLKEMITRTNY